MYEVLSIFKFPPLKSNYWQPADADSDDNLKTSKVAHVTKNFLSYLKPNFLAIIRHEKLLLSTSNGGWGATQENYFCTAYYLDYSFVQACKMLLIKPSYIICIKLLISFVHKIIFIELNSVHCYTVHNSD